MPVHRTPKPKLQVASVGKRHYIQVPSDHSESLLAYLRRNAVHAEPPAPCAAGLDSIQLGPMTKAEAVQSLLDHWE
jgi:hypothetical protein